jgi:hypothetical protein
VATEPSVTEFPALVAAVRMFVGYDEGALVPKKTAWSSIGPNASVR